VIDVMTATRLVLLRPSALATLVTEVGATPDRGPDIYHPRIPGEYVPMPRQAIAFRVTGGPMSRSVRIGRARLEFRSYGADEDEASAVDRALYDRLHGLTNQLVSTPDGTAGLLGFYQSVAGAPLEDPATGWPFFFSVWECTHATQPVG
jgi:hypothetical protein